MKSPHPSAGRLAALSDRDARTLARFGLKLLAGVEALRRRLEALERQVATIIASQAEQKDQLQALAEAVEAASLDRAALGAVAGRVARLESTTGLYPKLVSDSPRPLTEVPASRRGRPPGRRDAIPRQRRRAAELGA